MKSFARSFATILLSLAMLTPLRPAGAQNGSASILHELDPDTEGGEPNAPVIGADGNLYTTTRQASYSYAGTILQITPTGVVTVLHDIDYQTEGQAASALALGGDGALYGTTQAYIGGATIFRITTAGEYTTLFMASSYESTSFNALVEGGDGNLYGCLNSTGNPSILFVMTPSGLMTTLHTFTAAEVGINCADSVLARGSDGNVYGMTQPGSSATAPDGSPVAPYNGIFFRVSGGYEVLHVFAGSEADGSATLSSVLNPVSGGFAFVGAANLFYADAYLNPTLSEITTNGIVTILHEYDDVSIYSINSLLGVDGNFYFAQGTSGDFHSLSLFRTSADGATTTELASLTLPGDDQPTSFPLTAAGDGSFYGVTQLSIFRTAIYAPTKPVVTISAAPMKIDEKHGVRAKVIVERTGDDLTSSLIVALKFGGSAIDGKDYKKLAPTVTIHPGSSEGVIYVKALNVGRKGGHQTIDISVTADANSSYTVGKPSKATINIKDNG